MSSIAGRRPGLTARIALISCVGLSATGAIPQTTKPEGLRPLEGTYWKAVELAGKPVPSQDPKREATCCSSREPRRWLGRL